VPPPDTSQATMAVLGAAAGCAISHHEANKHENETQNSH
jgi:hypothetical protein